MILLWTLLLQYFYLFDTYLFHIQIYDGTDFKTYYVLNKVF